MSLCALEGFCHCDCACATLLSGGQLDCFIFYPIDANFTVRVQPVITLNLHTRAFCGARRGILKYLNLKMSEIEKKAPECDTGV